ncbi:uncharacterized protein LOC142320367 isoform X2 [Lycorma delicatula]|uniref:uncharacterized protein LOC142320367 isoform X2 n=1 Tax=Lycorma delicatula TaxID=130591 RepID=UPI003F50FB26
MIVLFLQVCKFIVKFVDGDFFSQNEMITRNCFLPRKKSKIRKEYLEAGESVLTTPRKERSKHQGASSSVDEFDRNVRGKMNLCK